jgi:hypothetical protein
VSSAINDANPEQGNATTASVRANFTAAKTEINNFERMTEDKVITSTVNAMTANFANDVTLVEGRRITVEIGDTNTQAGANVTLDVDSTGEKQVVRQDGSDIVIGDLKAGQYCDFMYAASGGSNIQDKWVWLNSPYAELITALKQDVIASMFPVGAIFTTTTNYSAANNGEAVSTALGLASTVQWQRYAKGRTIVGFDSGYTPASGSASATDVITLTFTASEGESGQLHPFGVGDTITTTGFSTAQANVPNGTVTAVTANTITYASSSSIASGTALTGDMGTVVNQAMDVALEAGGASNHVLSQAEMKHNHQWYKGFVSGSGNRRIELVSQGDGSGTYDASADERELNNAGGGSDLYTDSYTDNNRNITGETVTAHNNLQPYITTYIWKRTA